MKTWKPGSGRSSGGVNRRPGVRPWRGGESRGSWGFLTRSPKGFRDAPPAGSARSFACGSSGRNPARNRSRKRSLRPKNDGFQLFTRLDHMDRQKATGSFAIIIALPLAFDGHLNGRFHPSPFSWNVVLTTWHCRVQPTCRRVIQGTLCLVHPLENSQEPSMQ